MNLQITSLDIQEHFRKSLRAGLAAGNINPMMPESVVFETLVASTAIGLAFSAAGVRPSDMLMPGCVASCCAAALNQIRGELSKMMHEDFAAKNPGQKEQMI